MCPNSLAWLHFGHIVLTRRELACVNAFVRTELDAEHATVRGLVPTMPATVQLRSLCRTRSDLHAARLAGVLQLQEVPRITPHRDPGTFPRLGNPDLLFWNNRS